MRGIAAPAARRARAASGPLAFVFLALLSASPARAQQPLTRADSADVLVGTAERLHAQGAAPLAEALARMVERRFADTPAFARASALLAAMRETRQSSAGRVGLIAFTTIYGAWLGVAVPAMLEADRPEAFGLGLLTGAPLGFFGGRAFARGRSISSGDAGLITWSTAWGTWQGGGWQAVGEFGESCERGGGDVVFCESNVSAMFAMLVGGGLVGLGGAALVADRTDVSGGTTTMIAWGSLWGTWGGLVASILADADGDDMLATILVGGDVGFGAMALLAPGWDMSSGRAWLINAAGIMGAAIGGGIDLLIRVDDPQLAILVPAIGSAIGLFLGAQMTRTYDDGRIREGSRLHPDDGTGALVRLRDGEWRLALPQPMPVMLHDDRGRGIEAGLRIDLLHARF